LYIIINTIIFQQNTHLIEREITADFIWSKTIQYNSCKWNEICGYKLRENNVFNCMIIWRIITYVHHYHNHVDIYIFQWYCISERESVTHKEIGLFQLNDTFKCILGGFFEIKSKSKRITIHQSVLTLHKRFHLIDNNL